MRARAAAIADLRDKRAELAGQINQLLKQLAELRSDLAHVDATLRILEPGIDLEKIVPRHVEYRPRYFKRGTLTRLCLDFLRQHAGEWVTVADVMPAAVGERVLNRLEYRRVEVVVYEAIRKLAKRGVVEMVGVGAKQARFKVAAGDRCSGQRT
jgi:hypothetical protein